MTEASSDIFIKLENEEQPSSDFVKHAMDIKEEPEIDEKDLPYNNIYVEEKNVSRIIKTEINEDVLESETTEHCKEEIQWGELNEGSDSFVKENELKDEESDSEAESDKVSDGQNVDECGKDINEATSKSKQTWPKKYKCHHCGYSTAFPSTLIRHISAVHLKIKEHKCPHCDYSANSRPIIKRHIEVVHQKIKLHKCEHCDYSASRPCILKKHNETVHQKIRNYKCDQCDYTSSWKNSLEFHINTVHLKIKNHKCDYCDFRASHRANLKNHINSIHLKVKNYKCEQCDYSACQLSSLRSHIKNRHQKPTKKVIAHLVKYV